MIHRSFKNHMHGNLLGFTFRQNNMILEEAAKKL